jgi:acyl dehydratase
MLRNNNDKLGRYFEEFILGKSYIHSQTKKITDEEHRRFCKLTMNTHPLHLNEDFAKSTQFGRIVVVGTYIASIVVGISVEDISGKAIANLEYEKIIHHNPVFIGDIIRAETKVLGKRTSVSKPDRGIVLVETKAYNQNDILVLSLRRKVLIPLRK